MNALEKLKINNQLKQAIVQRDAQKGLEKLKTVKLIRQLRMQLGMFVKADDPTENKPPKVALENENPQSSPNLIKKN